MGRATTIMKNTWSLRNNLVFNKKLWSSVHVVQQAMDEFDGFFLAQTSDL